MGKTVEKEDLREITEKVLDLEGDIPEGYVKEINLKTEGLGTLNFYMERSKSEKEGLDGKYAVEIENNPGNYRKKFIADILVNKYDVPNGWDIKGFEFRKPPGFDAPTRHMNSRGENIEGFYEDMSYLGFQLPLKRMFEREELVKFDSKDLSSTYN